MAEDEAIHIERQNEQTVVRLSGAVDLRRVAPLWQKLQGQLQEGAAKRLVLELEPDARIDSAGVAFLRLVDKRCREAGIDYQCRQLPAAAEEFLRFAGEKSPPESAEDEAGPGRIARLGLWGLGLTGVIRELAVFTGGLLLVTAAGLKRPHRLRYREIFYQMQVAGAEAALFVGFLAFLMGFIMGIQAAATLTQFGAEIHIADVVTIGTLKEMAPLLVAVIIAGRSGAAFTAELGTMKIRQELDALRVMGLEPMEYLILPRVAGLALAGFFLTLVAEASGVLGGMIVGWLVLNLSALNFFVEVGKMVTAGNFMEGVMKGFIFAFMIGFNGCFQGLRTGEAAEDVGVQTTTAIVSGILLIVLADALLSGVFHVYQL